MPALPVAPEDPALDGWYHTIELGDGMVSRGYFDHRTVVDLYGIPRSLDGRSALDVGTGDGFFAFELERRGADPVVALDVARLGDCDWLPRTRAGLPAETLDATAWGTRFETARTLLGSRVERVVCDVYELSPERVGTFDVVFCGDLLLHLQNPLWALINIRSVTREMAVIETVVDPELEAAFPDRPFLSFGARAYESEPGAENTFWRCTTRALQDMLVYAGFEHTEPQGVFELPPHGLAVTSVVARP
jgi:tRNA (mo5U34)-methyltransferase